MRSIRMRRKPESVGAKVYPRLRHDWIGGMSYTEVAEKNRLSRDSVYEIMRRHTPSDEWPLHRDPVLETRVRSRVMKRKLKSVDPFIIMGLVDEFCEREGIPLSEFGTKHLGWSRNRSSTLYAMRNGHKTSIAGATAVKILTAIGEPIPRSLTSASK
jgi:hypothetical protein